MDIAAIDKKQLLELVRQAPVKLLCQSTECRYLLASNGCSHLSGIDLIGKSDVDIQPDKALGKKFLADDLRVIREKTPYTYIERMQFGDKAYYYEIAREPLFDHSGEVVGLVGTVIDVTELVMLREFYREKSMLDLLTKVHRF